MNKAISVIGAGQMGTGIAIVSALNAGISQVNLIDSSAAQLESSKSFIQKYLLKQEKNLDKPGLSEKISSFHFLDTIDEKISSSQLIVEAATENFDVKKAILTNCLPFVNKDTILATNTSSISITKLAATLPEPHQQERVIGMHFMNPVPVMKLVEVIPALQTTDSITERTKSLAESMGKTVSVSKDSAGFIANRILMPYINEAVFTLQESIGSKEEIDKSMKLGCNMPMGPLALADLIGLDTCLSVMQVLETELGEDKYRPCPLLKKYVYAGYLGKKSGKGFYTYPAK